MKNKGLVFILDGLGDRSCPQLGGRTPLQAAETPTLDGLAQRHQCGMMDPLTPDLPVDTHTGVGILFGLPPAEAARLRRGPVEAAGLGLDVRPGDILLRANFACVEKSARGWRILDRRAGRIRDQVESLCAALQDLEVGPGITASVHPATQHRAVAQLRGDRLSAQVSDTDPGGQAVHLGILDAVPENAGAQSTADAINRLTRRAHELLRDHPVNTARVKRGQVAANGLILRSAGVHQLLQSRFSHLGLKVAAVAGETTVLGLAKLLDFHCYSSSRFTSLPDTDLGEKLRVAAQALESHDLVFVHIKGTDTAAHDKNPRLKAAFIGRFDRALGRLDLGGSVVGVCADHSTDSLSGEHTGDPVPVLLGGPGGRRDGVRCYNEADCMAGALGRVTAEEYLTQVLDAMGALDHPPPGNRADAGGRTDAGMAAVEAAETPNTAPKTRPARRARRAQRA